MDDPQMLAQVFLMAALLVYVCHRQKLWALALTALFLVIGINIKQILIEFALAILIDLLFVSRRRALQFALIGGLLSGLSIALNIRFGGPGYLAAMLAPRNYSFLHVLDNLTDLYAPLVVPGLVALGMAIRDRKHPQRRIVSLLFFTALFTAVTFGGGSGVWINALFGGLLSLSMLLGLFFAEYVQPATRSLWLRAGAPLFLFAWLCIPLGYSGNWRPVHQLEKARAAQDKFQKDIAILAAQPGPALCESLLRCYYAQKPYVYDPYNSTRLVLIGKLDLKEMVAQIEQERFGAVQLERPLDREYAYPGRLLFAPAILNAIRDYYQPLVESENGAIYLPKREALARAMPQTPCGASPAVPVSSTTQGAANTVSIQSKTGCGAF